MRKGIIALLCCGFVLASSAMAAPVYVKTWDFEDGTVGQPHPDWNAGTVQKNGPYSGTPYPKGNRLYTGDNVASWHTLAQPTNSFIYTTQMWTDAGNINGIRKAGMGYRYAGTTHEVWFEGDDQGGWPANAPSRTRFGDSWLPNPRPGTEDQWDNYQWQGGGGRRLERSTLDGATNLGSHYLPSLNTPGVPDWEFPQFAEIELMIKYNTPDNPGTVELWFRSLNYNATRSAQDQWLRLGWGGYAGANYYDFILGINPATNDYWEIDRIKLGGGSAWSQAAYDNVYFQSIPEPTTLGLLLLGAVPTLRRRR
ncbi:MAG TPA: PEP-CTERM sorting domain-containing protein [Phycisphaerae bacterium]|nr:PEP-CTERM sorting domain-containing protein [Phycisphaerae bacterium]HRR85899.1 PEP-CTERM sorting domain-containing protein [Phycisphaerae bacterium]